MSLSSLFRRMGVTLMVLIMLASACSGGSINQNVYAPRIISLTAEHSAVYPLGNTRVSCVADDPDGDALNYTWSSSGGLINGSGSQITWEAPTTYGDFNIMVTVDDGKGNSANRIVIVTVLVRDPSACCR